MAKLKMFAVRDGRIGAFMRPFFDLNVGSALRTWEEAVKAPESPFYKWPQDFVLYEIGEFDDDTGAFTDFAPPRMLSAALDISGSSKDAVKVLS